MIENANGTAIYPAGHGSKTKTRPRLIDLQYQRVLRYRRALLRQDAIKINHAFPAVFIDIRLPAFGMGHVTLNEVPRFLEPHREVESRRYAVLLLFVGLASYLSSAGILGRYEEILGGACGGNRAFGVDLPTAILHAIADRPLVNIQPNVIQTLHGGASYGVSESARSLSSAFVHQALLQTTYTCKLTRTFILNFLQKLPA